MPIAVSQVIIQVITGNLTSVVHENSFISATLRSAVTPGRSDIKLSALQGSATNIKRVSTTRVNTAEVFSEEVSPTSTLVQETITSHGEQQADEVVSGERAAVT